MATQAEKIKLAFDRVANDYKSLKAKTGDLSSLGTTAKGDLVSSINELLALAGQPQGAQIDDTATDGATSVVWSADKVYDAILAASNALKIELTAGAGAALDTFKELADALDNDPSFASTLAAQMTKRVRVDAPQTFTALEKKQACENIGIGDPNFDFVAAYEAAKI